MSAVHDVQQCVQSRLLIRHHVHAAGQAAARAHHLGQGLRAHSRAPPRHMPCKAGAATAAPMRDAASLPGLPIFHGQGITVAFAGAWGVPERRSASEDDDEEEQGWAAARGAASPAAVMPRAPPEWQPPTDPAGPSAPPEFMPPREPGAVPGTVPEFEPPEQAPPGTPRPTDPPTPGRPVRPDIPDPERDPLRSPERRRETSDPDEQPSEEPEPQQQDMMSAVAEYVEHCAQRFTVEDEERGGGVKIGLGPNSCPAVLLYHPAGYTAVVNMHGANVVSWRRPDGTDILHLRPDSPMDGVSPILGGVPLVFPQYGRASGVAAYAGVGSGAVPSHGFLQRLHWTLVDAGVSPPHAPDPAPRAVFAAEWDEDTYAMWPHRFGAIYTVSVSFTDEAPPLYDEDLGPLRPRPRRNRVDEPVKEEPVQPTGVYKPRGRPPAARKWKALDDAGNAFVDPEEDAKAEEEPERQPPLPPMQLRCELQIHNTDDAPFTFEAALQSHVRCTDIGTAEALGLGGKVLLDCDANPDRPRVAQQPEDPATFGEGRMDRVYIDVGQEAEDNPLRVFPGAGADYTLELIHRNGLRDLGVWNPHTQMPDRSLYRHFVALSSGAIARPVTLQPNEHWSGEMVLRLHDLDATRGEAADEPEG